MNAEAKNQIVAYGLRATVTGDLIESAIEPTLDRHPATLRFLNRGDLVTDNVHIYGCLSFDLELSAANSSEAKAHRRLRAILNQILRHIATTGARVFVAPFTVQHYQPHYRPAQDTLAGQQGTRRRE